MKTFITAGLALTLSVCAAAQTESTDSTKVLELDEVVVKAPRVVRKADMELYYPSPSAVENSKNGLQLLQNLMIPSLTVSDALGTLQAAGQSVQVRINGRVSTIDQVRTLLPETVKRVEWIDNPGLRYGGANYVINFIVVNPSLGGSLSATARPALNQPWAFTMADAKFNVGPSQWQIGANYKLTDLKSHRDYSETFTYSDGLTLTREESTLGGKLKNSMGNLWASYNYIKPDTTVFMVDLNMQGTFDNSTTYAGLLTLSDGTDDLLLDDRTGNDGNTPSLSLYLEQHLQRKQTLVVSFQSSFYSGRTYSNYRERYPDARAYLTDIHTDIKDRNQAYAVEANYIKNWDNSRFTAGVQYTANRNRSQYDNLGGSVFHQRQDKAYVFAEYFHRFGKWTATAGMGAQYTDFVFRESGRGSHSWSPRPQATITYAPHQNHNFRLNFTSWQSKPRWPRPT